jgi:hypothetical protein
MWATAPFLHNNSVGRPPLGPDGKIDPRAITVEGRLALFEDAIDQLLNPAKRQPMIKVTSADSSLVAGLPGVEETVALMILSLGKQAIQDSFHDVVADLRAKAELPDEVKTELGDAVKDLTSRLQPEIDQLHRLEDIAKAKLEAVAKIKGHVAALVAEKFQGKPKAAEFLDSLVAKFEAALKARLDNLASLVSSKFTIPKGTPLNLVLNLHSDKMLYALKLYLKHKHDPGTLAVELLRLSDCPDLVENRGHSYGSDLSPDDQRALIEYLKTL